MALPTVFVTGSIVYAILTGSLLFLTSLARGSGLLDKDNAGVASVVVTICGVCMWLFWACGVMHQWHPLIQPIYEHSE
ncbi:hypothetical protein TeGR_g3458 [Tetraparma gracilis]|uniref:Uncharacterized protein n=1 Tax=Tetraparma gracilis TaxID=2962635 RepID=A0ABQ6MZ90_9STRA|nr:hypothetical protein TeGR_g3458 [Tetraparma gracilis]